MAQIDGRVRDLVSRDDLEDAAELLSTALGPSSSELGNEIAALRARLARGAKSVRRGVLDTGGWGAERTRIAHALLDVLEEAALSGASMETSESTERRTDAGGRTVFLSYSHDDRLVADRLRDALESSGVPVRIDIGAMRPGQSIREFIVDSVRTTDVTVCLVSDASLTSGWVGVETLLSFAVEQVTDISRFVACHCGGDIFAPQYRLDATAKIDARLGEIAALLPTYHDERLDTVDLDAERARLHELRANLGRIITRLRSTLCVDLRGLAFDDGVQRLINGLTRGDTGDTRASK